MPNTSYNRIIVDLSAQQVRTCENWNPAPETFAALHTPLVSHVHLSDAEAVGGESPPTRMMVPRPPGNFSTPKIEGAVFKVRNTFIDVTSEDELNDDSMDSDCRFTHRRARSCPNPVKFDFIGMIDTAEDSPKILSNISSDELELHIAKLYAQELSSRAAEANAEAVAAAELVESLRLQLSLRHKQSDSLQRADYDYLAACALAYPPAAVETEQSCLESPLKVDENNLSSSFCSASGDALSTLERWPDDTDQNTPWRVEERVLPKGSQWDSYGAGTSAKNWPPTSEFELLQGMMEEERSEQIKHRAAGEPFSLPSHEEERAPGSPAHLSERLVSIVQPVGENDDHTTGVCSVQEGRAAEVVARPSWPENQSKRKPRRQRMGSQIVHKDVIESSAQYIHNIRTSYRSSQEVPSTFAQNSKVQMSHTRPLPTWLSPKLAPTIEQLIDRTATQKRNAMPKSCKDVHRDANLSPGIEPEPRQKGSSSGVRKSKCNRLWCHVYIDENVLKVQGFDFIPKLIGCGGQNTRDIWKKTDTKVRVRGRGSGHVETGTDKEANAHLMMAIAAEHGRKEDFRRAVVLVKELLDRVFACFDEFCRQSCLRQQRNSRFWMGELSKESADCLTDVCFPSRP